MIDAGISSQAKSLGQSHVLRFWDELTESQQSHLAAQLDDLDWNLIATFQSELVTPSNETPVSLETVSPPAHVVRMPQNNADVEYWNRSRELGEEILREGKVGVVLLAGGQGTRLGFPRPKGMFPIGPVSNKSLFELFAEQIIALTERYGHAIPYMIMTSDGTHEETVDYFNQHDFFRLQRENVFFFKQGYAPCVDAETGKLLCADKGSLCMSPDGHGGLLAAMLKAGLYDESQRRGIEYLFLHQVDNPLVKVCDPAFIGMHVQHDAEVSTKVVAKTGPEEKVGVAVDLNGQTAIIEYSDLPARLANEREENGELRYWAGSTAIHLFNRSFLERVATSQTNLPWHRARKKIASLDADGRLVQPESENGVKFERFLFDTLPLATTALIVETSRDEEFAPLKNSSGAFSPDYVRQKMIQVAAKWLSDRGIEVPESATIEISARFALSAEELVRRSDELLNLTFDRPCYLGPTDHHRVAGSSKVRQCRTQPIGTGT